ncbi:hypothetical protein ACHAXM_004873 [Skeletonema potamos]
MDPPDDDEVEAAAPPQQRRRQTRGVRWVEWTLRVTVSFVILSLLKLEPIARKWVRDHNSSIDLPHQEEKLLKLSTDDNDSQNKIIKSSSSSVVRNNKLSQKSESFPSQDSIENGWTSPHQVDCKSFVDKQDEIYKETATEPSFMMNIHPPSKDGVCKVIWEDGCWECDHITAFKKALSQYQNSYFLDIGGNIGMWSLSAAAANYQTVTIEVLPDNYRRFCLSSNQQPAKFRLKMANQNYGGTRVVPVDKYETILKDDEDIVQGVTIDSLNLPTKQPVVVKLDVEGHELSALSGATQFLQHANIVYANMELRPKNLQADPRWKSIFQVLHSKGLKPNRINYEDETPLDIDRLSEWKHFKHPKVQYFDMVWRLNDFIPPIKSNKQEDQR